MRIQGDSQPSGYPLAAAGGRTLAPRAAEAGTPRPRSRAPLALYRAEPKRLDVLHGVSAHAQRAIAAYSQNNEFEQRTQVTQLLGIDVYA